MRLSLVLLQIALVVVGILVYDLLRGSTADPATAYEGSTDGSDAGQARDGDAPLLRGNVLQNLERRLESVEKRQRALERSVAGRAPVSSGVEGGEGLAPGRMGAADVGDEDVAWFRAVRRRADALDRQETQQAAMDHQLGRLGLDLSEAQAEQVIEVLVDHQRKVREALRGPASPKDPEARTGMMRTFRADLERAIRSLVPPADAEKILAGTARFGNMRSLPDRSPPR